MVQGLVDAVYPGIAEGNKPDQYFLDRTILSAKNNTIAELNSFILGRFPGEEVVLTASDKVTGAEDQYYPIEYLNSITVSSLPLAHLAVKPGCPLMLLHNIDPANGLYNGTQMVLMSVHPHVLNAEY